MLPHYRCAAASLPGYGVATWFMWPTPTRPWVTTLSIASRIKRPRGVLARLYEQRQTKWEWNVIEITVPTMTAAEVRRAVYEADGEFAEVPFTERREGVVYYATHHDLTRWPDMVEY